LARKCPRCRTRVGEFATTCWKCKSPLKETEFAPTRIYYQERKGAGKKIAIIGFVLFLICLAGIVYLGYIHPSPDEYSKEDIGVPGVDYWYEENEGGIEVLKTQDGWTFDLNIRQEYPLEGIVLGYKYYYKNSVPDSPINTFSPIDIWVGVEDVCDNVNNYDYDITYFRNREIRWYVYNDYDYFKTHTGLNHIIPHNSEVYSQLLELKKGDKFSLSGYIVEPYGTRGDYWYSWPSDNQIGNYDCEVILVDSITVQ
jgi:hypothetical protein